MSSIVFFFFFSSRRRHTRSLCDWSSDVCSSDLGPLDGNVVGGFEQAHEGFHVVRPEMSTDRALRDLGVTDDELDSVAAVKILDHHRPRRGGENEPRRPPGAGLPPDGGGSHFYFW